MTNRILKPAPERFVRDPETLAPLPEEGEAKPLTPFWRRRLDDGDVLDVTGDAGGSASGGAPEVSGARKGAASASTPKD